jgi:predicted phosphate transport protein (TIGR00153 family)
MKGACVRLSLVPREQEYFRHFSELAANLDAAAQLLVEFMNDGDRRRIAAAILEHEHVGDKIVHDIVRRLNKSFITPIDREDIYDLAVTMDEVLDNIDAATDMVMLYRVETITEQAQRQAEVIAKATPLLKECMDNLEKPKGLDERIIAINSLENDGDRIHRDAIASLFDGDMKCTDIIKWKDIYEILEAGIDECEHVANVIESIVLKHN